MENPMVSEDILQRFFEICDLSDLSRFRLVSSQWRDLSLRRWRKERYMHIYQSPFKMTRRDEERVTSVCTSPILDKPYKSFILHEVTLSDETFSWIPLPTKFRRNNKKELPLMERFWNVCGESMSRLRLYNCAVHSVQVFRKVLFLPNLEELALEGIYLYENCRQMGECCETRPIKEQVHLKTLAVSRVEDWESLQLSWQLLLSAFPNVQALRLSCSFEHIEALTEALEEKKYSSISSLELDLRWPKMKGLKFYEVPAFPPLENIIFRMMDDKEIWSLRKLVQLSELKLESFIMDVSDITQVTNLLVNLVLECHGTTLKTMILSRGYSNLIPLTSGFNLNTIPLSNLTELEFIGEFYENFSLFEETPKLRILRVWQVSEGEKVFTESCAEGIRTSVRLGLLQVLHFGWSKSPNSQVSREWMEIFVEVMPNMKELKAPLSPAAFQVVCEKWRELRCLKITSSTMDDGTLTGMVPGREERLPNITNLKYLQVLKIKGEKLTDGAVWNGLLQHTSLHTLTVTLSHEASNEAFQELFDRFSGGKVSRAWIPHSVPEKTRKMKKQLNKELWKRWSSRKVLMYTSTSPTLFNNDCQVY